MALRRRKSNRRRYRPYRERYVSPKTKWAIALSVLGVIAIGVLITAFIQGWITLPEWPGKDPEQTTVPTEPPEDTVIHIVAGGDVNITDRVVASGGSGYDYSNMLLDVMPVLAGGDLTLLNFEGNVYGDTYGSTLHAAPPQLLTALQQCGVDILQTANSQAITNGLLGLNATTAAIRNAGMQPLGTYADQTEFEKYKGFLMYEVQGVRVAVVAFTKGMDGRNLPEGNEHCVNLLYTDYSSTYKQINEDLITEILEAVNAEAPDITIAMLHWGSEYNDTKNSTQGKICTLLSELGVDAIIGSHPHYVQQMGFDPETGLFVAYSLGDFTGDAELNGTNYSVLLDLTITKDGSTGKTVVSGFEYVPIYLHYNEAGHLQLLRIREAIEAYEHNNIIRVPEEVYNAMKTALTRIESRVNG